MPQIDYDHELTYLLTEDDRTAPFPGLWVDVRAPGTAPGDVDLITVQAHLDTGAERSVFDGSIGAGLGLVLFEGQRIQLAPTAGAPIDARIHEVEIEHYILGRFRLRIAFTLQTIRRNLLGRDFFDLIQIGFRERESRIYVVSSP